MNTHISLCVCELVCLNFLTAFCRSASDFFWASETKEQDWNVALSAAKRTQTFTSSRIYKRRRTHCDRTAQWDAGSTGTPSPSGAPSEAALGWRRRWPKPWKPPSRPPPTGRLQQEETAEERCGLGRRILKDVTRFRAHVARGFLSGGNVAKSKTRTGETERESGCFSKKRLRLKLSYEGIVIIFGQRM